MLFFFYFTSWKYCIPMMLICHQQPQTNMLILQSIQHIFLHHIQTQQEISACCLNVATHKSYWDFLMLMLILNLNSSDFIISFYLSFLSLWDSFILSTLQFQPANEPDWKYPQWSKCHEVQCGNETQLVCS